jgi:succinoglycan biosynthesis protein ExoA
VKVTVVLLTHHRLELVKLCISSILNQTKHNFEIEIYGLLNGKDEETRIYIENLSKNVENFKYIILEESIPVGEARNKIIEESNSEYLCFLDDDVEIPNNYFEKAQVVIDENKDIDVFGGPDQPKTGGNDFQKILSLVMQSFFAMGPTRLRHTNIHKNEKGSEINLILCNLWMKKELFNNGFAFPKNYIRNEENILLAQLDKANKKLLYIAEMIVFHERKQSIQKLIRVTYLSGKFRTIGFFDEFKSFSMWFLVPQIFIILLISLMVFYTKCFYIACLLYLGFILILSIRISYKARLLHRLHLAMTCFIIYNFIYPIGQFTGYITKMMRNEKYDES